MRAMFVHFNSVDSQEQPNEPRTRSTFQWHYTHRPRKQHRPHNATRSSSVQFFFLFIINKNNIINNEWNCVSVVKLRWNIFTTISISPLNIIHDLLHIRFVVEERTCHVEMRVSSSGASTGGARASAIGLPMMMMMTVDKSTYCNANFNRALVEPHHNQLFARWLGYK